MEESAVLGERDSQVFGVDLVATVPLTFEIIALIGESLRELWMADATSSSACCTAVRGESTNPV